MKVQEVEAKKVQLETEQSTALTAAKALQPATAEFDEAYSRYLAAKANLAKIPAELGQARLAENAVEIQAASATVAEAIKQVVDGLKVAGLLGLPVISIKYLVSGLGTETEAHSVVFNPTVRIAGTKAKGESGAPKGKGRTVIIDAAGSRQSLTKFVLEHATDAEKATQEYKYPHTRIDTLPKFNEFCTAHNLTGFEYQVAEAEGQAAPAEAIAPEAKS